jgi:hypothetical protein
MGDRVSTLRRRGLQIDDPLGPGRPTQPSEPDDEPAAAERSELTRNGRAAREATEQRRSTRSARKPHGEGAPGASSPATAGRREQAGASGHVAREGVEVWREWTGLSGVGSFRLPHELLLELGDTARELGLPIGMIVTAAITQLLDQPPDTIAALVDRADDARIRARRIARRRLTERPGG